MSTKVTPEYEAAVTKLADERKNQRFLNDSHDHAKLLAELMIGRADEDDEVLIYSQCLPSACFSDALKRAKSENIRVILDNTVGTEEINKLPPQVKDRIKHHVLKTADGAHFFVAGNSFRLEIDHDNAKAIANFNDPEAIQILKSRFETLWLRAE